MVARLRRMPWLPRMRWLPRMPWLRRMWLGLGWWRLLRIVGRLPLVLSEIAGLA